MTRRRPVRLRLLLPLLVVVLAVPALALAGLWRWADGVATAPTPDDELVPPTPTFPGGPSRVMATELASFRRVPGPIAAEVGAAEFRTEVADLTRETIAGAVEPSCVSVFLDDQELASSRLGSEFVPASIQRLLVTAVAFEVLGPRFRFTTEVLGPPIVDGVVTGDLVLVGGGDPLLATSDDIEDAFDAGDRPDTPIESLADQLVAAGLVRVDGDIVGDGSRYDDEWSVPSWGVPIPRGEAGPYGALLVNRGRLFGAGYGLNPAQSAANEFNRLLSQRGVEVAGRNRSGVATEAAEVSLATVESVPLTEVVDEMFRSGDPNIAELLVKELAVASDRPGTRLDGLAVVRDELGRRSLDVESFEAEDGSGIAAANRVSCELLAGLLASESPDGPLVDVLEMSVDGQVLGRTATLDDVDVATGLVEGAGGEMFAVALIVTAEPDAARWEALVDRLTELPAVAPIERVAPR